MRKRVEVQKKAKAIMQRISKENVKPTSRKIGKVTNSSPGLMFDYVSQPFPTTAMLNNRFSNLFSLVADPVTDPVVRQLDRASSGLSEVPDKPVFRRPELQHYRSIEQPRERQDQTRRDIYLVVAPVIVKLLRSCLQKVQH